MSAAQSTAVPSTPDDIDPDLVAMHGAYTELRTIWDTQGGLSLAERKALLKALLKSVRTHKDAVAEAIDADFAGRSKHETLIAEVFIVVEALKHSRAHVSEWMRAEAREVSLPLQPASAKVITQPKGIVGVISPWNYPFQLALLPIIGAISAGNRVMLKQSEYTPRTAALVVKILAEALPSDVYRCVEGGPKVGAAFSALPFDHLVFTGSTSVGRKVMAAAAANLTPLTLELGGKSPGVLHSSFPVAQFAKRIVSGKLLNAGQTCIAPDYVLVPRNQVDAFVEATRAEVAQTYPTLADNPDYTAIVHDGQLRRLQGLLDDATEKGARVVDLAPAGEDLHAKGKLAPTLLLDVTDEMTVMQDEIFGPVLPVVPYDDVSEALAYINARPRPLALYYFDRSRRRAEDVLEKTWSGGVTINDVLLHISQESLPFGGIGPSGMGAYHGYRGYLEFSHEKAVFQQARFNTIGLFAPPYGRLVDRLLRVLLGA